MPSDALITPIQRDLLTALHGLPRVLAVPGPHDAVHLLDPDDGAPIALVIMGDERRQDDLPQFLVADLDLIGERGPCFHLPPAVRDLVATWRGWEPSPNSHPCATAAALLSAVELVAGVEPDEHRAIRLVADGEATGRVIVAPALRTDGTPVCTWTIDIDIDHPSGVQIRDEGIEHAIPTAGVEGIDEVSWVIRRATTRAAQRVCQQAPICPTPRLRAAPTRVRETGPPTS